MSEAVIAPPDLPTLRVVTDGSHIEVSCDLSEWASVDDARDFAAWLEPVVDIFIEHDAIARATGQAELTPERMAAELVDTARALLHPSYLVRLGPRWRFYGKRPPPDPPARRWLS